MKPIEVRVPHGLDRAEARRRIDAALVRARDEYADRVGAISAEWRSEDQMELRLDVMGMPIDGELENAPGELVVRVTVPALASLFAGQIRAGIEERLGGLLGQQPA